MEEELFYTTVKQSKDLLALGLPAESADMCYRINDDTKKYMNTPTAIPWRKYTANRFYLPCWSVGALIKAYQKYNTDRYDKFSVGMYDNVIGMAIAHIDLGVREKRLDFTKTLF